MKYYVYISDSKVDMLLPQIPHETKRKIATEFKLDIKIFGAARRSETETEENRIFRLETVAEHIYTNEDVGTLDQPATYFAGSMPMRWGPFGENRFRGDRDEKSPIVYFAGSTGQTLIGLGGSSKHVIGNAGPSNPTDWLGSVGPILFELLMRNATNEEHELNDRDDENDAANLFILGRRMTAISREMGGPDQHLEFLAKKILAGETMSDRRDGERFLTLGTPLYVALAD